MNANATEAFYEKQLKVIHDAVTERFGSQMFWNDVSKWCCPDCRFTRGPVVPEYIIDEGKQAISREDPVKIAPYIYHNGRYIAAAVTFPVSSDATGGNSHGASSPDVAMESNAINSIILHSY